jgi:hypothetical protein
MSYSERERFDEVEEAVPELRFVVRENGATNGVAKKRATAGPRMRRIELNALGWEARRKRLAIK